MSKIYLKTTNYKLKTSAGFTLIEVLIVVFIIGLLASVVLVGLGAFRQRGRDARRVADLRSIQNALELYYSKNGVYPSTRNLVSLESELVNAGIGVSNIPNDPSGGSATYQYASDDQSYVLRADLEDKNNQVLKEDVDGSDVIGLDCGPDSDDDQYYCLRF